MAWQVGVYLGGAARATEAAAGRLHWGSRPCGIRNCARHITSARCSEIGSVLGARAAFARTGQ